MLASRADVYTIRCSCKQWPCTYTAPCVARTCWEESQTHIVAMLWQRRSTGRRTPSNAHTPTIGLPGGASRTHAAHTHTAQIRHPAAHAGSCATPTASHDQPPDSTKARPTIKPDRLFLLHDGTGHRPAETIGKNHTARPPPALEADHRPRREQQPPRPRSDRLRTSTQTARKSRSLNRPAHAAGHQKQGTA